MAQYGSTYKRLMLVILLALSALASATAQGGMLVSEGDTKTYQVDNHAGSSYSWTIYNESTFKKNALNTEAIIVTGQNASTLSVNWLKTGTYYPTVVETDQKGCTNTKAIVIVVNKVTIVGPVAIISNPTVIIGNLKYIMSGACQSVILDASKSTGEGLTFHWEPSIYLDNANSATPVFTPGTNMNYVLTVTDINGLKSSASIGIMVSTPVKADAGESIYIAVNQSTILDGSKSTGDNLSYLWENENGPINGESTTVHPVINQPGKYYLTVTDQFGCFDTDSIQVNWFIQAIRDTAHTALNFSVDINVLTNDIPKKSLNPATLTIINPPQNGNAMVAGDSLISYSPNPDFAGSDAFEYSICDYFQHCAQASVLVLVDDVPLFIPDAFSPNGDGLNDQFEIKGLAIYSNISIEIVNRWGNVVYRSNNYGHGNGKAGFWDGNETSGMSVGSGPVPAGTYYYILKMNGQKKISGAVYMER